MCDSFLYVFFFHQFAAIEKSTTADVIDEDDQMDWESCGTIDGNVGCAKISPSTNQPDQVFVVPDTNIFLSSLICIKDIIAKGIYSSLSNSLLKIPF